jgi:hypothetical protein
MPRGATAILGAVLVAGGAAFMIFGLDDAVRCQSGAWRNEYGCVAPCPPGSGRTQPGSAACIPEPPAGTPVP